MTAAAHAHIEKARRKLRVAELLLAEGEATDSISRSYYAMYNAARAALLLVGEEPRTHRGVADRFWIRFVEENRFSKSLGVHISHARQLREGADYDAFIDFDYKAAAELLSDATAFVEANESQGYR